MYHSITFGNRNSWDDWHLVPKSRLIFTPPSVKTKYVDIPGANGSIDLTDTLTGMPAYENRQGTFEFYVINGYGDWASRYTEILTYLHGKKMRAYLEDDPLYYYSGRFAVDGWASENTWSVLTISYNVEPYKYTISSSTPSL